VFQNAFNFYLLFFLEKFELIEFLITECDISIQTSCTVVDTILTSLPTDIKQGVEEVRLKLTNESTKSGVLNTHRSSVISNCPQHKRYLFFYCKTGTALYNIAKKYDLHKEESYKKFTITVGDIILGFYRIEDTVPLLQQELGVSPRTAALLGADVLDFLAPLSDPAWIPPEAPQNTEVGSVQNHPSVPIAPHYSSTPQLADTITRPAATTPLYTSVGASVATTSSEPLSNEEPVHKSEQPSSRIPLSAVPSYSHPIPKNTPPPPINLEQPPRWGA
jgi:hypothetical protein